MIPRAADGTDEPRNLFPLCRSCHDFIDRHSTTMSDVAWLTGESSKAPAPRWANILLLKLFKAVAYYRMYRIAVPSERVGQSGPDDDAGGA
jgi:hypothetical protein